MGYKISVYNGTYQLEYKGYFDNYNDAIDEFQRSEVEYMEQFEHEVGTTEYNQELENFMFNSRIDKIN